MRAKVETKEHSSMQMSTWVRQACGWHHMILCTYGKWVGSILKHSFRIWNTGTVLVVGIHNMAGLLSRDATLHHVVRGVVQYIS